MYIYIFPIQMESYKIIQMSVLKAIQLEILFFIFFLLFPLMVYIRSNSRGLKDLLSIYKKNLIFFQTAL